MKPGTPVWRGVTPEQPPWQEKQPGQGVLEQERISSGDGITPWQRLQVMLAWRPLAMGKQRSCPVKLAGDQRQKVWHPRQFDGKPEWFTPFAAAVERSLAWHTEQSTVGRAKARSRRSPWQSAQIRIPAALIALPGYAPSRGRYR